MTFLNRIPKYCIFIVDNEMGLIYMYARRDCNLTWWDNEVSAGRGGEGI